MSKAANFSFGEERTGPNLGVGINPKQKMILLIYGKSPREGKGTGEQKKVVQQPVWGTEVREGWEGEGPPKSGERQTRKFWGAQAKTSSRRGGGPTEGKWWIKPPRGKDQKKSKGCIPTEEKKLRRHVALRERKKSTGVNTWL